MVLTEYNPSGSRPNFFGRQHLPLTRDGHGCPKLNAQSFARMRNRQSVHKGAWMPEVERPEFRKDAKQAERSYGKCGGARRGDSAEKAVTVGWCDVLLKHYCFTAGHHFDEYRKLNLKNPQFTLMADFLCWEIL